MINGTPTAYIDLLTLFVEFLIYNNWLRLFFLNQRVRFSSFDKC